MTAEIIVLHDDFDRCDVFGQIAFKFGANRLPDAETVGLPAFAYGLPPSPG